MYALNFNTVLADFIKYVEEIKKNQVNDIIKFKEDLKKWGLKYLKLDPSKTHEFTPYVHTFVHHIDELISLHKNIHLYNLQGLENLNSFVKKSYHNSTNKAKLDKASQVILYSNYNIIYKLYIGVDIYWKLLRI